MPNGPEPATLTEPEAQVRRGRRLPVVWLVPLVAGAIAIWLAVVTLREQGPTITVGFATAEGLEAGKTQVRYKEVALGLVEEVRLTADRRRVEAVIAMEKQAAPLLTSGTRFWVVRPRVGLGGVSGLGTVLSGAFVALDPGAGEPAGSFTGLEEPPPITSDVPGRRFMLEAMGLGSLGRGAPVSYHGLTVGQVLDVGLDEDRRSFTVEIFVEAPHDALVRDASRFWNAGGVDLAIGAQGVDFAIESLQSLVVGGVAFDTPGIEGPGEPSAEGRTFGLFESRRRVDEPVYRHKTPYLVHFEGSVRGLRAGAPVEFGGLQVGTVTDVRLVFDAAARKLVIPVALALEPERIGVIGEVPDAPPYAIMAEFVRQGLRAQLKSGNLLTGELLVELAFHPEAPPAELATDKGSYPAIPSVPMDLEAITRSVSEVLEELAEAPIGEVLTELRATVEGLSRIVNAPEAEAMLVALKGSAEELRRATQGVGGEIGPLTASLRTVADASAETMRTADATLASVDGLVGRDSKLLIDLSRLMAELSGAARSIRGLADYLERHPEALLRGRSGR